MAREARGVGIALVLIALGALILVPTSAVAKKKKKPKSPPVTVVTAVGSTSADDQPLTLTPTCPPGLLAVGGGFDSPPTFEGSTFSDVNVVYESRRAGDNAWQVSAVREDAGTIHGNAVSMTAMADCRSAKLPAKKPAGKKASASKKKKKKKLKITEVSASGTAPGNAAQATATATCPGGTQALGGGFSSSPRPNLSAAFLPFFWASYRNAPNSWLSAFTNQGPTVRNVTSYAYCASGLKIAQTSGSSTLSGGSSVAIQGTASSSSCTKGRALLGGGFNNTPITAPAGPLDLVVSSKAVGPSWQIGALQLFTVPATLGSVGYCA